MELEEKRLLEAWRAGDLRAGNLLFRRLFGPLRRFFANKVRERGHIEDLLATTFETLVRRGEHFEGRSAFRTFAFGVAYNVLRDYYRKLDRNADIVDPEERSIVELGAGPFSFVASKDEEQLLLHALRRIPLVFQVVLELYFWEGLRTPKIAELLDVPEGTVRSRLRLGREHLSEQLATLARGPALLERTVTNLDAWAEGLRQRLRGESRPKAS